MGIMRIRGALKTIASFPKVKNLKWVADKLADTYLPHGKLLGSHIVG